MTDDDARMRLLVNEPVLGGAKFVSKLDSYIPEASTANSRRGFFVYSQKLHSHIPECRGWLACLALCQILPLAGCGGSETPQTPVAGPKIQQPAADSRPIGFAKRAEVKVDDTIDLTGVSTRTTCSIWRHRLLRISLPWEPLQTLGLKIVLSQQLIPPPGRPSFR